MPDVKVNRVCHWTRQESGRLIQQPAQLPAPCISFPKLGFLNSPKVRPCLIPSLIQKLRIAGFESIWLLESHWPCASFMFQAPGFCLMYGNNRYPAVPYPLHTLSYPTLTPP